MLSPLKNNYPPPLPDLLQQIDRKLDFLLGQHLDGQQPLVDVQDIIQKNGLPVVFIADARFLEPTLVAIYSLCRHALPGTSYHVFLILTEGKLEEIDRIQRLFPNLSILQTTIPAVRRTVQSHVTESMFIKFDLPHLLPANLNQVLYLDGDIIVRKDLSAFIQMDLGTNYAGAVQDLPACWYNHPQSIGMKHVNQYFNSGVLLLNLKKMREDHCTEKLYDVQKSMPQALYPDQDCFNLLFEQNVLPLSYTYNMIFISRELIKKITPDEVKRRTGKNKAELLKVCEFPHILHYAGNNKPWKTSEIPGYYFWLEEKTLLDIYCSQRLDKI